MIQLPYGVKYFGQNSLFLPTFSVFLPRFLVISNRKPLILPRFRSIFSKFFQNLWILKTSYFKRGYQNVQINRGHLRQGSGGEIFRFNLGRPNPDRHYGWFIILGKFGLFWNILQQFRGLWIILKHFPTEQKWFQTTVYIGRRVNPSQIKIKVEWHPNYVGDVAIDDITFSNCDLPLPPVDPCPTDHFMCRKTFACLPKEQLCDYTDQCGDGSDESDCDTDDYPYR